MANIEFNSSNFHSLPSGLFMKSRKGHELVKAYHLTDCYKRFRTSKLQQVGTCQAHE